MSEVQDYLADHVKTVFNSWNPKVNEFDMKVARKLRAAGTKLFSYQRDATGAVSDAIAAEAKAVTDISIAIEAEDDVALGEASNAGNSALAQVRGVCDF